MDRALLVGINAYPSQPLRGCVNDVQLVAEYLASHSKFDPSAIRQLVDAQATKQGILDGLNWLLDGLHAGDRAVFHYSGHGTQLPSKSGHEVDGLDEVICPVDFDWTDEHTIRDKEFHTLFGAIPEGVEFVWISDSCHSGDLDKAMYFAEPEQRIPSRPRFLVPPEAVAIEIEKAEIKGASLRRLDASTDGLNLGFLAACQSFQSAADADFPGRPNGAFTFVLVKELLANSTGSINKILDGVQEDLVKMGFRQSPLLAGAKRVASRPFMAHLRPLGHRKESN